MNIRPLILVFLLSFFKPLESVCGDPVAITQEELVRRAQELFDAVVPGNKEPWQNTSQTTASSQMKKAAT